LSQCFSQEFSFDPEEAGFKRVPLAGIVGGSAEKNKDILLSVLRGIPSAHYETVLLNGFYPTTSHKA
jgi:anthranilate phosphoribosyltransferase